MNFLNVNDDTIQILYATNKNILNCLKTIKEIYERYDIENKTDISSKINNKTLLYYETIISNLESVMITRNIDYNESLESVFEETNSELLAATFLESFGKEFVNFFREKTRTENPEKLYHNFMKYLYEKMRKVNE